MISGTGNNAHQRHDIDQSTFPDTQHPMTFVYSQPYHRAHDCTCNTFSCQFSPTDANGCSKATMRFLSLRSVPHHVHAASMWHNCVSDFLMCSLWCRLPVAVCRVLTLQGQGERGTHPADQHKALRLRRTVQPSTPACYPDGAEAHQPAV